jgi:hypothetical protein
MLFVAERNSSGFRRQPGQLPDAGSHPDQALVHQHVQGFWVLLAKAPDLYPCYSLHRNNLLGRWHQIHLHPGKHKALDLLPHEQLHVSSLV